MRFDYALGMAAGYTRILQGLALLLCPAAHSTVFAAASRAASFLKHRSDVAPYDEHHHMRFALLFQGTCGSFTRLFSLGGEACVLVL